MQQEKKGLFISVEGGEGVGKTTNLEFIIDYLRKKAVPVVSTREPGGTPLSEEIRELLLKPRDENVSEVTELLMMFAARAQHLKQKILPALEGGDWVVCDRFTDATYAYQGGGRGMELNKIAVLENLVQGDLRPDRVILLDLPVEIGMDRARKRGELDRFESQRIEFFQRVRSAYLQRAAEQPQAYRIIDASLTLDKVQQQIQIVLDDLISESQRV